MSISRRLLGLACASADTLIEIDAGGCVVMAIGAGPASGIDPGTDWIGRPLIDLFDKASGAVVTQALAGLQPGVRAAPLDIVVTCGPHQIRRARLRTFCLPEIAPAVSCALIYDGAPFSLAQPRTPPMLDAEGLINRVQQALREGRSSEDVALAFVDIPGLIPGKDEQHQRAEARIEAALQSASVDGASAARLTPKRFAVLRNPEDDASTLADQVRDAGAAEGLEIQPTASQAGVDAGLAPGLVMRVLRVALKACIESGDTAPPDQVFADNLRTTLQEAERFTAIVRNGDFALHFQPIVDLTSGEIHHLEALARFGDESPAGTVSLAEDLGLIDKFDLAVVEKALKQMRRPGFTHLKVAVNISGASLSNDTYIQALLNLTKPHPEVRARLLVEVTETESVGDLVAANRRLGTLREAGIMVCLDDFGVGAASFEYLQSLSVDIVKIDGSFIRDVVDNARTRTLLGHLVGLCHSLKVSTIAEMIETEEQANAVRALGIDMGQGYLFGRPSAEPVMPVPVTATPVGRRQGEVSGWG
ncbi:EAL domain-containing protein [uncultured Brevundimonas sp.]|uniref:EAL domain-containing protein n=1 Tax=uncultured Brevundimonas sp. TaxID=213418 RepID=UPI0030EEC440|tara:strand:- start:20548 stop:22146 length:1599 start_codon:yes stop_codon:yes gene_type:complete